MRVLSSGEWLRDPKLRDKIYLELDQVLNITQLTLMAKYCMKGVIMADNTSQDMGLTTFDRRVEKMKASVQRLERFVVHLGEAQRQWMYLLHFVKFSSRGEIDRDVARLYNTCTEDLKKIEMMLQHRSDSLLASFAAAGGENEQSTENLRSNLASIMDDVHSSIQSLLDACPRLSLLSYNRLVSLSRAWLMGPQLSVTFISQCMHELFEGVGGLNVTMHHVQRLYMCTGFVSYDKVETVRFAEPVPLNLALDQFVNRFDLQLRQTLESACDVIVLHRMNCIKALLTDTQTHVILDNMSSVFAQRTSQLLAIIRDMHPNIAYLLVNYVSFTEDMWTTLGHPTGCAIIARPDLAVEHITFARAWRTTMEAFLSVCKDNITLLQESLVSDQIIDRVPLPKSKALLSSLLLQEISFLRTIEEVLSCKCLESASELWAGRYQMRFQYKKDERYRNAPVDVNLGSVVVPYGLEYTGGHIPVVPDLQLEQALERVLCSSFSSRGSVFISYDNQQTTQSTFEAPGEYAVSCKDVAAALGKVSTTLCVSENNKAAVNFYLARLVYLDAIGSVDFTNIDHRGLQTLVHCMTAFWNAIEAKNDPFVQDALRYPLKTRFSRNELHSERKKENLTVLRNGITQLKKSNRYAGLIVIGMASETFYTHVSVFDHFYRSIFNSISIPYNQPINYIGMLLTARGFVYGMELQATLKTAFASMLSQTADEASSSTRLQILELLSTSREVQHLVLQAARCSTLFTASAAFHLQQQRERRQRAENGLGDDLASAQAYQVVSRFKCEMLCFCSALWNRVLVLACVLSPCDLPSLRNDLFTEFYKKFETVSAVHEVIQFDRELGCSHARVYTPVNNALLAAANRTGLICNHDFIAKGALLWNVLASKSHNVLVLCGEAAVGKTALRDTVVEAIRATRLHGEVLFGDSLPLRCVCAGRKIFDFMTSALAQLRAERAEEEEETAQQELQQGQQGHHRRRRHRHRRGSRPHSSKGGHSGGRSGSASDAVNVSVIHHASLSVGDLLGGFDSSGRWRDGLLVRKIRAMDEFVCTSAASSTSTTSATNTTDQTRGKSVGNAGHSLLRCRAEKPTHILVLNGPIGYNVEQLFSSPFYLTAGTSAPAAVYRSDQQEGFRLTLPSGEIHTMPWEVKVVIEANDISHASPACISYIPILQMEVPAETRLKHLLTAWMRSVINWLGDFPPWLDFLDFLNYLLLKTKFVEDLIGDDFHHLVEVPSVIIVSRVASFLRYLEDLLSQCHAMAMVDATFAKAEELDDESGSDSDSSSEGSGSSGGSDSLDYDDDTLSMSDIASAPGGASTSCALELPSDNVSEEVSANGVENGTDTGAGAGGKRKKTQQHRHREREHSLPPPAALAQEGPIVKGCMTLGTRQRSALIARARLSIIYAAVWGLGGAANVSDRRKFFDSSVRDAVENYFQGDSDALERRPGGGINSNSSHAPVLGSDFYTEIVIPSDCTVFECELNLKDSRLELAVQRDPRTMQLLTSPGVPSKYSDLNIFAEVLAGLSEGTGQAQDRLVFRTPSTRSVEAAFRILLGTGANVVMLGEKAAGKTMLISDVLGDLAKNCPTPSDMRNQINANLVDIVNGVKKPEGIFAVLDILKYILAKIAQMAPHEDDPCAATQQFADMWRTAGVGLKVI